MDLDHLTFDYISLFLHSKIFCAVYCFVTKRESMSMCQAKSILKLKTHKLMRGRKIGGAYFLY